MTNLNVAKKQFLSLKEQKTLLEKERMLVASIFSFSNGLFQSLLLYLGLLKVEIVKYRFNKARKDAF